MNEFKRKFTQEIINVVTTETMAINDYVKDHHTEMTHDEIQGCCNRISALIHMESHMMEYFAAEMSDGEFSAIQFALKQHWELHYKLLVLFNCYQR